MDVAFAVANGGRRCMDVRVHGESVDGDICGRCFPPWRRPSCTSSPAELGLVGENLPLRAYDVSAFDAVSFLKASRAVPAAV
jgi:hypothetical protein